MMKIDHIAMYVSDLEAARSFFMKYFAGTSSEGYHNPKTGFRSYFISFEDGCRLELMNRAEMTSREKQLYPKGYAHIAFSVGSREKVDSLTKRLVDDGFELVSGPRTTGDGCYESCLFGIEDNIIEITI